MRSEGDYGQAAEQEMAARRADYFEAGTLVVWDVDPVAATIASYTAAPEAPLIFRPGETAHAEPALPGFQLPVAEVVNRVG